MKLNKIYCEDCRNTMKRMPDNFIDLTVTSPPYDELREYNGYIFDFELIARELFRITKSGGVVVWIVGDQTKNGSESGTSFRQALYFKEIGFNLHDTMIYSSRKPPLTHNRYEQSFEYMFVFSKYKLTTFNPIMRKNRYVGLNVLRNGNWASGKQKSAIRQRPGKRKCKEFSYKNNIWFYNTGGWQSSKDSIAFKHPAIFPEQLAADHIYSWSNEGDLIYDPFGGSGTVAKKAIQMKRNWIISEISKEYCAIAEKRIKPYLQQLTLAI